MGVQGRRLVQRRNKDAVIEEKTDAYEEICDEWIHRLRGGKGVENLKNHLDNAFQYISKLPVSGDAVDLMALVRMELRSAWKEAEKLTEQAKEGNANESDNVCDADR